MTTNIIPSNPADIKVIKQHVNDACDSMLRIDSEREHIKSVIDDLVSLYPDINVSHIKRAIRDRHKASFMEKLAENDDYAALYVTLFPVS